MTTIKILPNGNQWRVTKRGRTVWNHRKKSAAKASARRAASSGDTIQERARDGTILNTSTRR